MSDVYLADELEQEYSNTIEESEGCFLSEGQEDEEKTEQFQFLKLKSEFIASHIDKEK